MGNLQPEVFLEIQSIFFGGLMDHVGAMEI